MMALPGCRSKMANLAGNQQMDGHPIFWPWQGRRQKDKSCSPRFVDGPSSFFRCEPAFRSFCAHGVDAVNDDDQ